MNYKQQFCGSLSSIIFKHLMNQGFLQISTSQINCSQCIEEPASERAFKAIFFDYKSVHNGIAIVVKKTE